MKNSIHIFEVGLFRSSEDAKSSDWKTDDIS